ELITEYERYMISQHIPDVLECGYFISATFSRNGNRYRIRYEAASQDLLDKYSEMEAPGLRNDFAAHFPNGIELTRENWEVVATLFPQ
ncbi:MAG: DUF4286 family protein, partial [Gammaproteobacteria bacterium]